MFVSTTRSHEGSGALGQPSCLPYARALPKWRRPPAQTRAEETHWRSERVHRLWKDRFAIWPPAACYVERGWRAGRPIAGGPLSGGARHETCPNAAATHRAQRAAGRIVPPAFQLAQLALLALLPSTRCAFRLKSLAASLWRRG